MSYCDLELPEFFAATEHRAAKEYDCCECLAPITIGTRYVKCVGKWDGRIGTHRQHDLCALACEHIRDKVQGGECIVFGDLKEWHREGRPLHRDRKARPEIARARQLMAQVLRQERALTRTCPHGTRIDLARRAACDRCFVQGTWDKL